MTFAELELSNGVHIDDAALYWLLGLSGLRSLSLAGCVRVTDIGLCLLGSKLPGLRQLNLSCCYEVVVMRLLAVHLHLTSCFADDDCPQYIHAVL